MKSLKLVAFMLLLSSALYAMPNSITYQGSLKEQGVPVNGTKQMLFRLTDATGAQVYWTSPSLPVTITQGLFAVVLTPSGVDWQAVSPYLEISVEGQLLSPREPITAGAYALMSNSVVDGAVTPSKFDTTAQQMLVPSGLVAIFSGNCPTGWERFSELDDYFPRGSDTFGNIGGSLSHTHSIPDSGPLTTGTGGNMFDWVSAQAADRHVSRSDHVHTVPSHNHGGSTGNGSSLPPYKTVIFCKKL